jgi:hypothetical protein
MQMGIRVYQVNSFLYPTTEKVFNIEPSRIKTVEAWNKKYSTKAVLNNTNL